MSALLEKLRAIDAELAVNRQLIVNAELISASAEIVTRHHSRRTDLEDQRARTIDDLGKELELTHFTGPLAEAAHCY